MNLIKTFICWASSSIFLISSNLFAGANCNELNHYIYTDHDFLKRYEVQHNGERIGELSIYLEGGVEFQDWDIKGFNTAQLKKNIFVDGCKIIERLSSGKEEVLYSLEEQWSRNVGSFSLPYKNTLPSMCQREDSYPLSIFGENVSVLSVSCVVDKEYKALYTYSQNYGFISMNLEKYDEQNMHIPIPIEDISVFLVGVRER